MKRAIWWVLFCCFWLRAEVPTAVAIKGAKVVTVSGAEIPTGTVLLRDGLIEDVGPGLTIPADAWVIDGNGLTVYPGFIDGLSSVGIQQPTERRSPESHPDSDSRQARPRGPEDRPKTHSYERAADLVQPSDRRLEPVRAAGFTTAVAFPQSGILGGEGVVINLAGERGADMVVLSPAGQYVALNTGSFFEGFPNSLMGVISYVRQLYSDLDWFRNANAVYAKHVSGTKRPGYDHYLEGLATSPRLLLPAEQAQQIDRMLQFGTELKQPIMLYGLHEGYRRIEELQKAGVPLLISLKWPVKPKNADPAEVPNYRTLEERDRAPAVPALLAKANVKFGFYTDGQSKTDDLTKALRKAIDAGLPREAAIRALTLNTAEFYGVADRLGSIEKGKIANLVVSRGDAFADKTKIEYVFVDGRLFRPSETPPEPDSSSDKDDSDEPDSTTELENSFSAAQGQRQ
jgi:imidazolonepropionase-like amidohydrolase